MILWKGACVAAALWLAVTVSGDCPNATAVAEKANYTVPDAKKFIGLGVAAAVTVGAVAAVATAATGGLAAVAMVGVLPATGGLVSALIDIFDPKDDKPQAPPCQPTDPDIPVIKALLLEVKESLSKLSNLVHEGFDKIEKDIAEAVVELKLFQLGLFWKEHVQNPMEIMRGYARTLVSSNFSRGSAENLAISCRDNVNGPHGIAVFIWSLFAAGCKSKGQKTTTVQGLYCDPAHPYYTTPCKVLEDACFAELAIQHAGHNHTTADLVFNAVMGTVQQLITYQALCVNYTFKDPGQASDRNKVFSEKVLQILKEMPVMIVNETERYWPGPANELAKTTLAPYRPLGSMDDGMKETLKVFGEKFRWYRYSVNGVFWEGARVFIMRQKTSSDILSIEFETGHYMGNVFVSRTRYATAEDKTILKKRFEAYGKWLDSPLAEVCTDNRTVHEYLDWTVQQQGAPYETPKETYEFLERCAGGETNADRNTQFANIKVPTLSDEQSWHHTYCDQVEECKGKNDSSCQRVFKKEKWDTGIDAQTGAVIIHSF